MFPSSPFGMALSVDSSNVNATSPFGFLSLLSPLLAAVAGSVLVYDWPWSWQIIELETAFPPPFRLCACRLKSLTLVTTSFHVLTILFFFNSSYSNSGVDYQSPLQ